MSLILQLLSSSYRDTSCAHSKQYQCRTTSPTACRIGPSILLYLLDISAREESKCEVCANVISPASVPQEDYIDIRLDDSNLRTIFDADSHSCSAYVQLAQYDAAHLAIQTEYQACVS